MESAVRLPAIHPPRAEVTLSGTRYLIGLLLCSAPFMLLSVFLYRSLYLSDSYAQLLSNVLVQAANGRLDRVILAYPPVTNVAAWMVPNALWLMLLSSLAMGALVWMLWNQLTRTRAHVIVRLLLLVGFVLMPISSFAATQSLNDTLTLMLILAAWISFNRFTRDRITWNGFLTGLILACGFYVGIYAAIYTVFFTLSVPLFFREADTAKHDRWPAIVTAMVIVIFPVGFSFLTWSYLNWIFTGNFFNFLAVLPQAAPLSAPALNDPLGASQLLFVPLYLIIGLLELLYSPTRLLAYLAPVFVITITRLTGGVYPEVLALMTYSLTAIAALPRRASAHWGWLLILAAVLQIGVQFAAMPVEPQWLQAVQGGVSDSDRVEVAFAEGFRSAGTNRIMLDDRTAYRLIARTGSGQPFLVPGESLYELAASNPASYVDYILMSAGDRVAGLFPTAPRGFTLEATWGAWQLYRRDAVRPLFAATALAHP